MKARSFLAALLALTLATSPALARDSAEDGTYDAMVTTSSGSYHVNVEVQGGEVTHVYWPNGGQMSVMGGDLNNGSAAGFNRRGDVVFVKIDDSAYNSDPDDD
jgi:hypothetical protein